MRKIYNYTEENDSHKHNAEQRCQNTECVVQKPDTRIYGTRDKTNLYR